MRRRTFLKAAGLAVLQPFATAPASAAEPVASVAYQLSWIKDFQFAGEYVADARGYYAESGVAIDLLAGGPNLAVEPVVMSGRALVGQSSPENTANANANGADLKIIGAVYQKSPFCILSLADRALPSPRALVGRKIGIQAVNMTIWRAFLAANGIAFDSVETVPVQYDLSPLASGEVDGFLGFSNDDVVNLRRRAIAVTYFLLADHGYEPMTATFTARASSLSDPRERALLVKTMRGDIRGWQDVLSDAALGAKLTTEVYGKGNGLDPEAERESLVLTNDLMVSDITRSHGLFWMGDDAVRRTLDVMASAGLKASPDLFTDAILQEVYQGRATP